MTIHEVADAALEHWERDVAITMVAIAGAESAYRVDAKGDRLEIFNQAQRTAYAPFAADGYLSFGPWQIFLGVHTPTVRAWSGLSAPQELASWLCDYDHNALMAADILMGQGFKAWSTYNNDAYRQFLEDAESAIDAIIASRSQPTNKRVVAVSLNLPRIHLDLADGTYVDFQLENVRWFDPWIRFDVKSSGVVVGPQLPLIS